MIINTRNFGEIEVDINQIINFVDGIPGFDHLTKFVIMDNPDPEVPFKWLQSIDDGDFAFVIINPFLFKPDYDFEINKSTLTKLEIEKHEDIVVYSIVVVPEDLEKMTANLAAPIIINANNKKARQVILDGGKYNIKHYIMEELKNISKKQNENNDSKAEEAL